MDAHATTLAEPRVLLQASGGGPSTSHSGGPLANRRTSGPSCDPQDLPALRPSEAEAPNPASDVGLITCDPLSDIIAAKLWRRETHLLPCGGHGFILTDALPHSALNVVN